MLKDFARIRNSRPDDAEALARIYRESWELAYRGIIPEPALLGMIDRRGTSWWDTAARGDDGPIVLEAGRNVAGYATAGKNRSSGRYQGEIYELYLGPIYQGLGFGELLFEAARTRLDMQSLDGLVVWALVDNIGACSFYERRGGRQVATGQQCFAGKTLDKIAFGWI